MHANRIPEKEEIRTAGSGCWEFKRGNLIAFNIK
jgi:hypothetical protein